MPPAAPLPTMMMSQRSEFGLIESASRFDSSRARVRLTSRAGSGCIMCPYLSIKPWCPCCPWCPSSLTTWSLCVLCTLCGLLAAVLTILPVFGFAPHELAQELVPLVAQLLVNPDLRCVITLDGRLLRHREESLQRRVRL